MAVTQQFMMYPFAEMYEVTSEGTTSITLTTLGAYSIVTNAQIRIKTAATGGTSPMVELGAGSDVDGLIVSSAADGAAGTIYGDAVADLGDDWAVATGASSGYTQMPSGVLYTSPTAITLVLDGAVTTEGVYQVFLAGFASAY
jgi:hypothetical protein